MELINENHVKFKSKPFWYLNEKYGQKPNTIRHLEGDEWDLLKKVQFRLKKISIENTDTGEEFTRDLTDVSILPFNYVLVRGEIVCFSWKSYKIIDD